MIYKLMMIRSNDWYCRLKFKGHYCWASGPDEGSSVGYKCWENGVGFDKKNGLKFATNQSVKCNHIDGFD